MQHAKLTLCLLATFILSCAYTQKPFEGKASWYGPGIAGNYTANGEIYDPSKLTAAHKTLEFGTLLRITNLANGLSVDVRINDRGPYIHNRVIDLSQAAATKIGMKQAGIGNIRAEFIDEVGELDFPTTATYPVASDQSLNHTDVAHPDFEEGKLLLAYSSELTEPIMVRTVNAKSIKNDSNTLLVSESLFEKIGRDLKIYDETASTE